MNLYGWLQFAIYLVALLVAGETPGKLHGAPYQGERTFLSRAARPRWSVWFTVLPGIDPEAEMSWKTYAGALLLFNLVGFLFLFLLLVSSTAAPQSPGPRRRLT